MAGAITCWAVSPSLLLQVLWKYISHIEHIPLGFAFHCSAVSAFQWCPWKPAASLCFGRRGVAPLMEEAYFSCSFCWGGFLFSFWFGLDLQATRRTWGAWTEDPGEGLTQTCCPHKSSGMSGGLPCHQKMVYLMGHGIRSACSSQNFCPEAYLVEISFLVFSKFQLSWWASNGLTRKELKPCANILTPNSENVSNQPDYQKMVGRRLRKI